MLNISQGTLRKNLKDNEIEIRSYQGSKKKYNISKEYLKKELENKSILEISKETGCTYGTVYKYIKTYEI